MISFKVIYLSLMTIYICSIPISAIRQQSVAIKGILKCGDSFASGVHIKLWDEDNGPDPDDVLDEGYTDSKGAFSLKGSTRELTTIDPVFKIYHDCDDKIKPGQRKVKFRIPSKYVTANSAAKKVFDIGVLNLETIFSKEERNLF